MTRISNDEDLFQHAARARGRVVVVTGQVHTISGGASKAHSISYLSPQVVPQDQAEMQR